MCRNIYYVPKIIETKYITFIIVIIVIPVYTYSSVNRNMSSTSSPSPCMSDADNTPVVKKRTVIKKKNIVTTSICESNDCHEQITDTSVIFKVKRSRSDSVSSTSQLLLPCYSGNEFLYEVGVDEAGRGPLFGRVYTAAVILPKSGDSFDYSMVKDSKKFHSEKKIKEAAEYVKQNAIAWAVSYEEHTVIDTINIRKATIQCMQRSVKTAMSKVPAMDASYYNTMLLVDGNDFIPISQYDVENDTMVTLPHMCIEGGDNTYANIAAASILAKVARDTYIDELCDKYPLLDEYYAIRSNKGYGAKKHLDGIREHGITQWHRRSYGICKEFA